MTKNQILQIAFVLLISAGGDISPAMADTPPPALQAASVQPAEVHVSGDTLYYFGNISEPSTQVFKAAVANVKRGQLTRLVISSVGGDTKEGREVAKWVRDMSLIVEVETICFSTCANYIFPAGSARVIRKNALVGWHGNERGMVIEAAQRGMTLRSELRKTLPPEVLKGPPEVVDGMVDQLVEMATRSNREEAAFYSWLGLNDAFSVCAVGDVALEKYPDLNGKKGWGFSINDMNRLGLTNITYLGDGAYEKESIYFLKYLSLLSAQDCLSWLK